MGDKAIKRDRDGAKMNKRDQALWAMRIAGYHGDQAARIRLLVESRVGRTYMNDAWGQGTSANKSGIKCNCRICKKEAAS